MKLLKPTKLNFESLDLHDSDKEQVMILTHYIISRLYLKDRCIIPLKFIEISNHFLTKNIFNNKNFKEVTNYLKENYILICNDYYNFTEHICLGYRLNFLGNFNVESYDYTFKKKVNERKFTELFVYDTKIAYDLNTDVQTNFISKLILDTEKYNELKEEKINDKEKTFTNQKERDNFNNHINIIESEVMNFEYKKHITSYDNFSGRFYNFFTNKSEYVRKSFLFEGKELGSIDISNSQIYFFTQLENLDLSKYNFIDKDFIKMDKDFTEKVLKGEIYEYIADKLNIDKKKAKKQLLSYLYGDTRLIKIKELISNKFPETFKTIEYLQNINTGDDKYNFIDIKNFGGNIIETEKKTYCNYVLQNIEKTIMLESLKGLTNYFTIHDSVYFEKNRLDIFKSQIENYIINLGLNIPNFK